MFGMLGLLWGLMIDISTMSREERLDLARRLLEGLEDDYGEEYRVEPTLWVDEPDPPPTPLHFWEWRQPSRWSLSEMMVLTTEAVAASILQPQQYQYQPTQYSDLFTDEGAKIGQSVRIRLPQDYKS